MPIATKSQQVVGAVIWWALIVLKWAHATFVARPMDFFLDTVLGNWEEGVKSAVRESFAWLARFVNGFSARVVVLFVDPDYYTTLRAGRRRPTAWQRWWAERARRGTFNAVLERDGLVARASPSPTHSPGPPFWTPRGSLPRASGSYDQLLYEQQQRQVEILLAAERLQEAGDSLAPPPQPRRHWLRLLWPFGTGHGAGSGGTMAASPGLFPLRMRRSGSELFDRPSGYAAAEGMQRRGLLEEGRISLELAVTGVFDGLRSCLRTLLLLPKKPKWGAPGTSRGSSAFNFDFGDWPSGVRRPTVGGRGRQRGPRDRLARTRSFGRLEDLQVWTVSDCILQAGFPLEEHVVTTEDGCILHMQRIPRKGSRDVVFFQHGVLDTSLAWVSNGIQGSQAFAAWDQGHDVWLGNARSNPPRMHADPQLSGGRYWYYTLGELGTKDIAAQVEHIHAVKTRELRPGIGYDQGGGAAEHATAAEAAAGLRRTYSDSAVAAMHLLRPSPFGGLESQGGVAAAPAAAELEAATSEQLQQGSAQQAAAAMRTSASLDGGQEVESLRRRMRRLSLRVQVPAAAGYEPSTPAESQVSTARAAGEKVVRMVSRHFRIVSPERQKPRRQLPPEAASGCGNSPFMSHLLQPDRSSSGMGGSSVSSTIHPGWPPSQLPDGENSISSAGQLSGLPPGCIESALVAARSQVAPEASTAAPEHLPSAPAGSQGALPLHSRLSSLQGTTSSLMPRTTAAQHQALTPDKIAIRGVEQPGEVEAASTPLLLLPTSSGGSPRARRAAATPGAGAGSEPYRLRAVGHSLGGASLLIYAVHCCLSGHPHHLRRMVLLTPAGFHTHYPTAAFPFVYLVPGVMAALSWIRPGWGLPVYLPSSLLRYITFKLSFDLQTIPGLNELTRAAMRLMLSNDSSEWDRALQMPHYNTYGMPAISLHTGAHLIQLIRSRRFKLYDFGSAAANRAHHGQDKPLDIAANYNLLEGLPVDLVAGGCDGIIAEANVQAHYDAMREAGVQVTFKRFAEVGHLDMTFAVKEEVRRYVVSRLQLP